MKHTMLSISSCVMCLLHAAPTPLLPVPYACTIHLGYRWYSARGCPQPTPLPAHPSTGLGCCGWPNSLMVQWQTLWVLQHVPMGQTPVEGQLSV
jgi:hypothetical protein